MLSLLKTLTICALLSSQASAFGAAAGIGYAAVRGLIEAGYFVFGSVRKETDAQRFASVRLNFSCKGQGKATSLPVMFHIWKLVGGRLCNC